MELGASKGTITIRLISSLIQTNRTLFDISAIIVDKIRSSINMSWEGLSWGVIKKENNFGDWSVKMWL